MAYSEREFRRKVTEQVAIQTKPLWNRINELEAEVERLRRRNTATLTLDGRPGAGELKTPFGRITVLNN